MSKIKKIIFAILGVGIASAAGITYNALDNVSAVTYEITKKDVVINDSTTTVNATVATTFIYDNATHTVSVDFAGYNTCRNGGFSTSTASSSSEADCKKFLNQQIKDNIKWAKQGIDAVEPTDYSDEINSKDLTTKEIIK